MVVSERGKKNGNLRSHSSSVIQRESEVRRRFAECLLFLYAVYRVLKINELIRNENVLYYSEYLIYPHISTVHAELRSINNDRVL